MNERLKSLRKAKGLTLQQIAKELNISLSAYSNYEQGIRTPSYEVLKKICEVFDVTSDYLIGIKEN